ncbi:MAG: protein YgfX [Gallionella sp.]|jgi:hypothetical protein
MPATFALNPSRYFFLLLLFLYATTLVVVCLTELALWARISINILIIFSFIHHLTLDVLLLRSASWRSIALDGLHVVVATGSRDPISGELSARTVITPYVIVLLIKQERHFMPACRVLFCDAMKKEAFRQLRVRLKYAVA